MANFRAFTLKAEGRLRQLVTECGITPLNKDNKADIVYYKSIWDTGATSTVITSKVAKDLKLEVTGTATNIHAGGVSQVPTYLVDIYLPNGIVVKEITVSEVVLADDIEILIGMDLISLGDFSLTNVNGKSCYSFRVPSVKEIDYVLDAKKKNKWRKPSGNYNQGRKKR